MSWGYAAAAAASLAAAWMGQNATAAANAEAYEYTKRLTKMNQAFQKEMSNTAHQREVEDLQKAGLNPILSAGGSGATTPAGGTQTLSQDSGSENYTNAANNIANLVNQAITNKQNKELQTRALDQNETTMHFNNERTWQEANLIAQQTKTEEINTQIREYNLKEEAIRNSNLPAYIKADLREKNAHALLMENQSNQSRAETWRKYNEPLGYFEENMSGGILGSNLSKGTRRPIFGNPNIKYPSGKIKKTR